MALVEMRLHSMPHGNPPTGEEPNTPPSVMARTLGAWWACAKNPASIDNPTPKIAISRSWISRPVAIAIISWRV